ncbi:MAG: DUF418 domain-containing protein [Microcella sp.]|uniref:DUF418 domain-containing protein n=1 Tax=Microcella sp. TaxID=1913979 RepID=UPI003314F089
MIAAHAWPREDSGELLVDGRPSVLFVVVAGVSLGFVTARAAAPRAPEGARREQRVRLLVRAAILLAMGLLLWMLPSGIAVILDYYGVLFVLALPLLFAARWLLAAVGIVLLAVAPLARDAIVAAGAAGSSPLEPLIDYLFTGFYPAVLWLPLVSIGLLVARGDLQRTRTRVLMVGGGSAAALGGYGATLLPGVSAEAHSGSTAELVGSGGLAFAIIGLLLVVLDSGAPSRWPRVVLAPLAALGRVALTVYVGQVVVIAMLAPLGPAGLFSSPVGETVALVLVGAGILFGLACTALGRRGPLEALLSSAAAAAGRAALPPAPRSMRD